MRSTRLATRRVIQTLRNFTNGPQLLVGLARGHAASGELVFQTRSGAKIHCPNHAGARVPVYEVFAEDAYRMGIVTQGLRSDASVLDIGAHIGCFTVAIATALPTARITAYEASPSTSQWLERNIIANGIDNRAQGRAVALSSIAGTLTFTDNAHGSSLNGITSPHENQTVEVPTTSFADAVEAAGGRVDLVKIDTEGAEYDFVLNSSPSDWATVERVVMEYHDVEGHSWSELETFFREAGLTEVERDQATPRQGTVWLDRKA